MISTRQKKVFPVLVVLIVFGLSSFGCGGGGSGVTPTTTSTTTTTTTTTTSTSSTSSTTTTTTSTTTTTDANFPYFFSLKDIDNTTSTECYRNPPTLVGSNVYIGTSRRAADTNKADNYFLKLDSSLNLVWAYTLESFEVRGAPALDSNNNIYFFACDRSNQYIYSLTNDGVFRWKYQMGSSYTDQGIWTPTISSNDKIYLGYSGKLVELDSNGNVSWSQLLGAESSIILDSEDKLYFSSGGALFCYQNGSELWSTTIDNGGESHATPAFSTDETYVYACARATLACIERTTGNISWLFTAEAVGGSDPPYFRGSPAVDENNNIYVGTKYGTNSKFYAINADGSQKWVSNVGYDLYSSPAIGNDGIIYVGSEGTQIQAFNKTNGSDLSGFPRHLPYGADITWSSPVISSSGILYIGNMSSYDAASGDNAGSAGYVLGMTVNATGLAPTAVWPAYMNNNARTGQN